MYFRFLYFIGDKVDTKTPTFCLLCPWKESSWVGLDLKLLIALTSFLSSLSLFCLWFPLSLLFVLIPKVPNFPRNFFLLKGPKTLSSCGTS